MIETIDYLRQFLGVLELDEILSQSQFLQHKPLLRYLTFLKIGN